MVRNEVWCEVLIPRQGKTVIAAGLGRSKCLWPLMSLKLCGSEYKGR